MEISVVIPTRNRKQRLISLLHNLSKSSYPIYEVIIVDSSDEPLQPADYTISEKISVVYLRSQASVCIQRNAGIHKAKSSWIFLCDDDVEVPVDYLQKIAAYISNNLGAGAVCGRFLQPEGGEWRDSYPLTSAAELYLKYIFQLGVWGEICCPEDNLIIRRIKRYYARKGNHISKAGWPVITHLSGSPIWVPVYTLGAAVVRKQWLLDSPYDEVLDKHGIGDNYGVAVAFPAAGVQLLQDAFVYHHHEPANRLQKSLQYYRRALALDYFVRTKSSLKHIKRPWFLWSLFGNAIIFLYKRDMQMFRSARKAFWQMLRGHNPYYLASRRGEIVVEPVL